MRIVGRRVHRMGDDEVRPADPTKPLVTPFVAADAMGDLIHSKGEKPMPKGVYPRKPRGESAAESNPAPKKKARKGATPGRRKLPGSSRSAGPRFWLCEDGSVQVDLPKCSGELAPNEASALVAFIAGRKKRA